MSDVVNVRAILKRLWRHKPKETDLALATQISGKILSIISEIECRLPAGEARDDCIQALRMAENRIDEIFIDHLTGNTGWIEKSCLAQYQKFYMPKGER